MISMMTNGWNILPIGSMYGIYANIGGILMVNVTIYSIHGSYGLYIYIVLYMRYGQNKRRLRVTTLVREGPVVSRKCTKPCKAIGPPKSDNL